MKRYWLALIALSFCAAAWAGFGLPKLPKIPGGEDLPTERLPIKIPGLEKVLKEKPALTVSLEDAKLDVGFLDDFAPDLTAPLTEIPYDFEGGWPLVMGGVVEHWAQSFCLDPGHYGAGTGNPYIAARLSGPLAGVVATILKNSARYLEIPQHQIQSLVWAVVSRAKISELSPELQDVAKKLLTPEQIDKLNGGALAKIPEEVREKVFGKLPPLARMAMEAQASLREMLAQHLDFEALERVAVLTGEPPEDKGDRKDLPSGRWCFDPEGFFVRYLPDGYDKTRIQLYVPERLDIKSDSSGRIVLVRDSLGNSIEIEYRDDVEPARVRGNSRVKAYAIAAVRLMRAGDKQQVFELKGGWTFTGLPSGKGKARDAADFPGLSERYKEAAAAVKGWGRLMEAIARQLKLDRDCRYLASAAEDLADLLHLQTAVAEAVQAAEDAPDWAVGHVLLLKRAWMTTMGLVAQGPAEQEGARLPWRQSIAELQQPVIRLASLAGLAGLGPVRGEVRIAWRHRRLGKKKKLPRFGPYGHVALPGRRARQRLGQSARATEDSPGKKAFKRARKVLEWAGPVQTAVDVVTSGPAGAVQNQVGFGVPNKLFGDIISFNMNAAEEISRQLGGDPPRSDFREIARPRFTELPPVQPVEGIPPARIKAINEFGAALHRVVAVMRAAQIALDRFGGASGAGDDEWATRQALAAMYYKRIVGEMLIDVAQRLRALIDELHNEGINEILVTEDAVRVFQQRLQDQGWDETERQAAAFAGLNNEQLEAIRQKILTANPEEVTGNLLDKAEEIADAFEELGQYLSSIGRPSGLVPDELLGL